MARLIGASKSSTAASLTAGNKAAADLRVALNGSLINQGSAPGAWTLKEQFSQKKSKNDPQKLLVTLSIESIL